VLDVEDNMCLYNTMFLPCRMFSSLEAKIAKFTSYHICYSYNTTLVLLINNFHLEIISSDCFFQCM